MMRFRKSSSKWMQAYMACILATQVSLLPIAKAASGPTDNSTIAGARGNTPQGAPNSGGVGAGSFTGAATYSIPIRVAPGVQGIQPNVTLGYSSQAASSASWVGAGWSLSLGMISRSQGDGIPQYDNVTDTFLYNGQEIDNTFSNLGGTWYTRRQSFLNIRTVPAGSAAASAINAWEVRSKGGTVSRFGQRQGATAEDCVIRNPNKGNKIYSWLLCEVEDVHGNIMRVHYDSSDAGTAHLDTIEYGTASALNRRVTFQLEPRPDHSDSYKAGFVQKITQRLDSIDVETIKPGTSTWELIKRYNLIYGSASFDSGRSLLRELTEYGSDGGLVTAALRTKFDYQSNYSAAGSPATTGWTLASGAEFTWGPSLSLVDTDNGDTGVRLGDVDGDGLPDLVKVFADPAAIDFAAPWNSTATITADSGVYLNTGSGFSVTKSTAWPIPSNQSLYRPFFAMKVAGEVWSTGRSLMDITGDGRVDFVGGSFYLNNTARAPWYIGDWVGGEWYDLISWPWYTSSESGWLYSEPYGSSDGVNWALLPQIDQGVSDMAKTGVSLEGEPKVITLSGNTRFADLQGDGLPDMIVRGARTRYAVNCLPIQGFGCIPTSYTCFNEETSPDRFAFGASYVIYNSGKDASGNVYFKYPTISTQPVPIESFNPSLPGGDCQFLFFKSTEYQPCDPTDQACHPYLFHNTSYLMSAQSACDNNKDDDGDGLIDFGEDTGCQFSSGQSGNPFDTSEASGYQGIQLGDWRFDGHDEYGNVPMDVNGDSLSDIVTAYEDEGVDRRRTVLNNGDKGYTGEISGWNLPSGIDLYDVPNQQGSSVYSKDLGIRFADVNGDGRTDLIQGVSGGSRNTYINDGDVGAGDGDDAKAWKLNTEWRLPSGREFVNSDGQDQGVRLMDVNGDGMTDIVQSKNGTNKVYLNDGVVPDLLKTVTGQSGGVTTIEYSPSTVFDNTGDDTVADLPQVIQVVSKITTHDPMSGNDALTTVEYEGGSFDSSDEKLASNGRFYDSNGFAGFRRVTVRNLDFDGSTLLRETHTTYHQGAERRGLVESTLVAGPNAGGTLSCWTASNVTYTPASLQPPYVSLADTTTQIEYNGLSTYNVSTAQCTGGTPRHTKSTVRYDGDLEGDGPFTYGNPTAQIFYGEVNAAGSDVDPADNRTSQLVYSPPNTSDYIVSAVAIQRARAGSSPVSGAVLGETHIFYDNDSSSTPGTVAPTKGNLTKQVAILNEVGKADPTTTFGYDSFGNQTTMTVPRAHDGNDPAVNTGNGTTTTTFDSTFHTYPVSVQNGIGHVSQNFYATNAACSSIAGAVASYPAGSGVVQEQQGPNDTIGGRPYICHDAHGRPVLSVGSDGLSKTEWQYDDSWTASPFDPVTVTTRQMVSIGGALTLSSTQRVDGLGRIYETQSDGPQGQVVRTKVEYDAAGRVSRSSAPYFDGMTPQYTVSTYDPLGRQRQIQLPGAGRILTASYEHQNVSGSVHVSTVSTDANNQVVKRRTDAFGNVVEVVEEGESGVGLPGGAYSTMYAYDELGQLSTVEDHQGNTTTVTYDLLGRKATIDDPDSGLTSYDYDANGNLIAQTTSLGTTTHTYDPLDRTKTFQAGVGNANKVTWNYDTAPNGKGLLRSRIDKLGGVTYTVFQYDRLGRTTSEEYNASSAKHLITTTYNGLSQTLTRTYPREENCGSPSPRTVEWLYDTNGYLTGIQSEGQAFASSVQWGPEGRLTEWTAGNGIKTEVDFDAVTARYDQFRVRLPGGSLVAHLNYAFDPGDRVIAIDNDLDLSMSDPYDRLFDYDGLNRLTEADGPYGANQTFVTHYYHYDPIGNLTCRASTSGSVCTGPDHTELTYPVPQPPPGATRPHTPTFVDSQPVGYDAAGNITSLNGRSYTYDLRGKLKSGLDGPSVIRNVTVDAGGFTSRVWTPIGYVGDPEDLQILTDDFEWERLENKAKIHLALGATNIATLEDGYVPKRWVPGGCGGGSYKCAFLPMWMLWWMRRRERRKEKGARKDKRPWLPAVTFFAALLFSLPASLSGLLVSPAHATPPQSVTYYHSDHLGSTMLTSDASGVVAQQIYRPFGEVVPASAGGSTDAPEFGFTGQRYQEGLGIYDYGARWYDPVLGRFVQPDSVVPDPQDPQSLNRYTYVRNNPVNRTDPTGNSDCIFTCEEVRFTWDDGNDDYWNWDPWESASNSLFGDISLSNSLGWDYGLDLQLGSGFGVSGPPHWWEANSIGGAIDNYWNRAEWATFHGGERFNGFISGEMSLYDSTVYAATEILGLKTAGKLLGLGASSLKSAAGSFLGRLGYEGLQEVPTPRVGQTLYRIYGGDSLAGGASWSPIDPRTVPNYRYSAGLPSGGASGVNNTGQFVIEGTLVDPSKIVKTRPALELDGNLGGLPEYVIPHWRENGAVRVDRVSGANPEF